MAEESKWYKNPQGWVATMTIAAMVLTFFYIRERQMWENSQRIQNLEARGDKAIVSVSARLERIEAVLSEGRDRVNSLERKIDRLDFFQQEEDQKRKQQEHNGYAPYQ